MLIELKVARNDAGQRAERYLRRRLASMSLNRLHSLFRRKEIKIDRKPVKRSHLLQEGDVIQVYGLRPEDAGTEGEGAAKPLVSTAPLPRAAKPRFRGTPFLHEDAALLVVENPAGLAVHSGTGIPEGESVIEKARA